MGMRKGLGKDHTFNARTHKGYLHDGSKTPPRQSCRRLQLCWEHAWQERLEGWGGGVLCSENLGGREFTSVRIQGMHYSKESHEVLNNLILAMKKLFYGDSQPVGPNPL